MDPNEEKNKKPQAKTDEKYDPKKDPANDKSLVKLPDERIGLLMVFRTFDRVSYGLIMQAAEPVNLLDTVNTP